ncbi:GntR family transcriptional regulator YhfZ [Virgibacillus necropolis]|uniref:Transcriptional regulator n=1 Tax=Virgibacillus necropolis TaxID=163877 RepID=A0A221MA65_9BACI|nr:GntR family transcriptional regulator YhfZ [Virgibacillus necropolis]ASN04533.1 transcriptional regulator [Virgibacillus necropolis]
MSRIWDSLFSKNGLAAKEIAMKLVQVEEGGRIPRVDDLVEELGLGRGTVQGALRVLENLHAVRLESKGHLGTFLMNKDLHLLKEIAGVGSLMGAMPLPYSPQYEGLATGLIETSEQMINRLDLAYMRGSKYRLEALKSRRYDFIIMSHLAAEEELKNDDNLLIAQNFGPKTYVSSHQIFFANSQDSYIKEGMRIGIDHTSIDQSKITLHECEGIDVELVPVNYMQLFDNLMNGTLDAAVWNSDENRAKRAFKIGAFKSEKARSVSEKASTAVIVIEKDRKDELDQILQLDKQKIVFIQQLVVDKKKLPHY